MLADAWPFLFRQIKPKADRHACVRAVGCGSGMVESRKKAVCRLLADRNYGCATVETGRDYACMSIEQQPPRVKLHIPASHALGRLRVPRHTLLAAGCSRLYMTNATSRRKSQMERSGVQDGGSDLLRGSRLWVLTLLT